MVVGGWVVRSIGFRVAAMGLATAALAALVTVPAWADDEQEPMASASASPLAGMSADDEALVETSFLLVGYLDTPGGRYVSADSAEPAWLTFRRRNEDGRLFEATTGCIELIGEWSRGPKQTGNPTRKMSLQIWGRDELPPCPPTIEAQDAAVRSHLAHIGAYTLAVQGPDALAYEITEDDLDARLWSHFVDHPDLPHLVLRDESGEARLIYLPLTATVLAACGVDCAELPAASMPPCATDCEASPPPPAAD